MKNKYKNYRVDREGGYGINLYRNTDNGKIAGVCAGLADHLNIDPWVVRVIFIAGLFVTGGAIFWAYLLAWFALSSRRTNRLEQSVTYDENLKQYRTNTLFSYRENSSVRIRRAKDRLHKVVGRIEKIEKYVSSKKYDLNNELAGLKK